MLKLRETALSHEDLFMKRYEDLLAWSLQLTENDRQQAEDLLHDAFIQFTLGRPDLGAILLSSTVGSEAWNSRDLKSRPH